MSRPFGYIQVKQKRLPTCTFEPVGNNSRVPKFLRTLLCCIIIIIVITIIYCYHDELSRNKNIFELFEESSTTIVEYTINSCIIL